MPSSVANGMSEKGALTLTLVVAGPFVAHADRNIAVASNAAETRLLIDDMRDSMGFDGRPAA